MLAMDMAERGWVPEKVVRAGIRHLLRGRLADEERRYADPREGLARVVRDMSGQTAAAVPRLARRQSHEVPAAFFEAVLGRRMKYSSGLWTPGTRTLDAAEEAMLALTCERADVRDGQRILDLGCGWGSLSLYIAERHPGARVVAVPSSRAQGEYVRASAAALGLTNVEVTTADVETFAPSAPFDRIISVEMFQAVGNWQELLRNVRRWVARDGRVFLHVFAHRRFAYPLQSDGNADWLARHFFKGRMMPSEDLLPIVRGPFEVDARWAESGTHYARTAEAWLTNLNEHRERALSALATVMPRRDAGDEMGRWRMFLLTCAELFGYAGGEEWIVSHVRLRP
jgi:cyclopropane-fatty-acyl-phospholipid synthase